MSALFQVGEDRYGYKYRSTNMRANAAPVYQCIRSTDETCEQKCLWLYKSSDGHWIATEALKISTDPINTSNPKFRTLHPVEDIRAHRELQWQYFMAQTLEWEGSMTFTTYPILQVRDADPPPMMTGSTAAGSDSLATVPETAISDITESQQEDVQ